MTDNDQVLKLPPSHKLCSLPLLLRFQVSSLVLVGTHFVGFAEWMPVRQDLLLDDSFSDRVRAF